MIDIKEYKAACADYHKNWSQLNGFLYDICQKASGHSSLSSINSKFFIIGRTYATGIERIKKRKTKNKSEGTLNALTKYIFENRSEVKPIFDRLSSIKEPLTPQKVKIIIKEHGRFLNLLQKKLKSKSPRSFASKYLHFHNPSIPIYDRIASSQLAEGCRWNKKFELFEMPKGADKVYYRFVMRFCRLYNDAKEKKLRANVRLIDNYLLWMSED